MPLGDGVAFAYGLSRTFGPVSPQNTPKAKIKSNQTTLNTYKNEAFIQIRSHSRCIPAVAVNFSSCNKDPQDNTEETNKAQKEAIVKQYLNHTVYPTYANWLKRQTLWSGTSKP